MSLTKSNALVNWSGISFAYTPPGGILTTISLTQIEQVDYDLSGQVLSFEGDAAPGPTKNKITKQQRHVTLVGADQETILSIHPGVEGTLVFTHEDMRNGTLTGAVTFTLINAMLAPPKGGGKHAEVGKFNAMFVSRWILNTDGSYTDPLTYVVAA